MSQRDGPRRRRSLEDSAHERPRRGLSTPQATDDTRPPESGREGGGRRASAGADRGSAELGVRPARLVRRSPKRDAEARAALRVLFRDFLAGGGLDFLRTSRCPDTSPNPTDRSEDR